MNFITFLSEYANLASSNVKVQTYIDSSITTPRIDLENNNIFLPRYRKSVPGFVRLGQLLHETAHAKWTDIEHAEEIVKKAGVPHSIWNIIEDGRINHRTTKEFSGAAKIFSQYYNHLFWKMKVFGPPSEVNQKKFIDRFLILMKVGPMSGVAFRPGREQEIADKYLQLIQSDIDPVKLAIDFYNDIKEMLEEKVQGDSDSDGGSDIALTVSVVSEGKEGEGEEGEGEGKEGEGKEGSKEGEGNSAGADSAEFESEINIENINQKMVIPSTSSKKVYRAVDILEGANRTNRISLSAAQGHYRALNSQEI